MPVVTRLPAEEVTVGDVLSGLDLGIGGSVILVRSSKHWLAGNLYVHLRVIGIHSEELHTVIREPKFLVGVKKRSYV